MHTYKHDIRVNTPKELELIVALLEAAGYTWEPTEKHTIHQYLAKGAVYVLTENRNRMIRYGVLGSYNSELKYRDDLNGLIESLAGPRPVEVKINDEYTAVVGPATTQVGCQTIDNARVLEVAEAIKKQQS